MKLKNQIRRRENKDRQTAILAEWVLFVMEVYENNLSLSIHSDFKLKRIRNIPQKRHTILVNEIFSARPSKAIPVVTIKITGPTKASRVLI